MLGKPRLHLARFGAVTIADLCEQVVSRGEDRIGLRWCAALGQVNEGRKAAPMVPGEKAKTGRQKPVIAGNRAATSPSSLCLILRHRFEWNEA